MGKLWFWVNNPDTLTNCCVSFAVAHWSSFTSASARRTDWIINTSTHSWWIIRAVFTCFDLTGQSKVILIRCICNKFKNCVTFKCFQNKRQKSHWSDSSVNKNFKNKPEIQTFICGQVCLSRIWIFQSWLIKCCNCTCWIHWEGHESIIIPIWSFAPVTLFPVLCKSIVFTSLEIGIDKFIRTIVCDNLILFGSWSGIHELVGPTFQVFRWWSGPRFRNFVIPGSVGPSSFGLWIPGSWWDCTFWNREINIIQILIIANSKVKRFTNIISIASFTTSGVNCCWARICFQIVVLEFKCLFGF